MNIRAIIQQHYQQRASLSIFASNESVCHTFDKLAKTGISHGNLFNPFSSCYKFQVQWDGKTAYLDGPYGVKMSNLITKVTFQPSISENSTTLDLVMQFPIADIDMWLVVLSITWIFICFLTVSLVFKLISLALAGLLVYGLAWWHFNYSKTIILKYLPREF
jgi:hypothetical protein